MSSGDDLSEKTSPRLSSVSTVSDELRDVPPLQKLPSVAEIDKSFEPIDENVDGVYRDPVQLHKMLIDERIKSQQKQVFKKKLSF